MIEVRGVHHRYSSDAFALRDVNLTLQPAVTGLVGVNGAGKSTLLSAIAGALPPPRGSVSISGTDLYGRHRRQVLPSVALMPQTLTLPGNLTALEVVSVIGWMRGLSARESRRRAMDALATVHLADQSGRRVRELSGGMKRRVALAQAIVTRPDVLLLDEPSTGLDPQQRRGMVDLIRDLPGTVLLSSHVMEDVADVATRVLVLHEGQIRFDGDVQRLSDYADPSCPPARRLEMGFLHLIATPRPSSL